MSAARMFVAAVVGFAVIAHLGLAAVILKRKDRGNGVWWLICNKAMAGTVIMGAWLGMVMDRYWGPLFYDTIPMPTGWLILAATIWQALAMVLLTHKALTSGR